MLKIYLLDPASGVFPQVVISCYTTRKGFTIEVVRGHQVIEFEDEAGIIIRRKTKDRFGDNIIFFSMKDAFKKAEEILNG